MVWLVFGTKNVAKRVPNGAQVVRRCDACHEVTTFYEKDLTSTFRLYFVDVYDYRRHRAMQCGACGACYATDELGAQDRDLGASIGETLEEGAGVVRRAASTVGEEITHLAARIVGRPMPETRHREVEPERSSSARERPRIDPDADLSDDDLAALDELEMKFRRLEAEDREKKRSR